METKMFETKNVSSKNVGKGNTIIATKARIPVDRISAETVEFNPVKPNFCSVIIMTRALSFIVDRVLKRYRLAFCQ